MKSKFFSLKAFIWALAFVISPCLPVFSQSTGAGTAVFFNGTTNAWINVPNGTWFSGNFTVEAWVYMNSYNNWSRLFDFSDGPYNYNVYLALTDGTAGYPTMGVFTNNDTGPAFSANTQLPLNQWVHVAATGNGTTGTIYLNGSPVGTGMLNIAPNILRTNNYIGHDPYAGDGYPNAVFDDLRIWNMARTRVQIQTEMNHSPVGNEAGLVGYWRFDEGSGTNAYDATGNTNTAGLNSGVTWTNSTAPLTNAADYALNFNAAIGQDVIIPHEAAQNAYPLTVMCWFMEPTNSPGGGALVNKYVSASHNGWQIAIDSQLYAWYWRDASDDVNRTATVAVNDGLWHHAAFVVSSAGGVIYLDGVPKQTNAWVGTAGPCTPTGPISLGVYQGDSFLTGNIDEVSIWNAALTQSQIQTYMHQPLQGTETGLVGYYRFNEGIGTNVYDYTTNADTGNLFPSANLPLWIVSGAQMQEPPEVVTLPAATNGNSVTLSGTLNPQGLNSGAWFRYGLTTGYGNTTATNTFAAAFAISTNTVTLNNLAIGTYHFQMVATNSSGTNYGVDRSFIVTVSQAVPQVVTLPVTLNASSETLNGTVNPEGLNSGSWFNWGLTTSYGNVTPINTFPAAFALFTNTSTLSGLAAGTYHFQIVATNAVGTNYGADRSFAIGVPQVTTQPATVNGASATLKGTVNPEGQAAYSWFNYGPTTSYGYVSPGTNFSASNNTFANTITVSNLFSGTYHFQIVAANGIGESFGADQIFTVLAQPPQVATLPATTNGSSATLNGTVNPEGQTTYSWFNWGLSPSYGNETADNYFFNDDFNLYPSASTVSNLAPGTYYFQIVANNGAGTSYGAQQSFTVLPQAPQVLTLPATVSGTSATLAGTVNPEGQPGNSWFTWGPSPGSGLATPESFFAPSFNVSTNTSTLSGLSPGTYYFQIVADNGAGESFGTYQSFVIQRVTPPYLTGAQLLGNGAFQFTFTDVPGVTFTVLATTNLALPLTNWVNLGIITNITPGVFQFSAQPLTNSQEFYRVLWRP